jgi:hypothetical protein
VVACASVSILSSSVVTLGMYHIVVFGANFDAADGSLLKRIRCFREQVAPRLPHFETEPEKRNVSRIKICV